MVELNIKKELPISDRQFIYQWLAGFYLQEMNLAMFDHYARLIDDEGFALLDQDPCLTGFTAALKSVVSGDSVDWPRRQLDLACAYAQVFLMGGPKTAPPYASAYVSQTGLLFQQPATRMTQLLNQLDMSVPGSFKEPNDHIGVYLSVMAELVRQSEDTPSVSEPVISQTDFLQEHLLVWVPQFCERCASFSPAPLYAELALATEAYLKRDASYLAEFAA